MEIKVAVTVRAVAKVRINEDGEPQVIGVEIVECRLDEPKEEASP